MLNICYEDVSKYRAIASCSTFAIFYVGSLYIKPGQLPRDHPKTIKERILRVILSSSLICGILYQLSSECSQSSGTFLQWLGIRWEGLLQAIVVPTLLTAILFLGPLVMFFYDYGFQNFFRFDASNIIILRNYVVAPFSEELVFRGCMMPLLMPAFGFTASILLAPWFFGLAHIHHAYEQYKLGSNSLSSIALTTMFQASYTTVFGILSSFIFLRTGHLVSPFLSHSFCNMMGFPEFDQALMHHRKYFICACFVVGLLSFLYLLGPLTDPNIYSNNLYTFS